jgi:hypothetical protein
MSIEKQLDLEIKLDLLKDDGGERDVEDSGSAAREKRSGRSREVVNRCQTKGMNSSRETKREYLNRLK